MGILIIPIATTAQRTAITPDVAELIYDTDLNVIFRGDGSTVGGVALADSGSVLSVTGSNVDNTDPINPIVNARLESVVAGANVTVDNTDPDNPIINASAASGGQVDTVVGGTGLDVDSTDPVNPIVNQNAATIASLVLADTALQSGDNVSELVNDAGYVTTSGGQVNTVVGGTDISVDATDPVNPIVNFTGTVGGQVNTVVGGTNVTVDNTDPVNPVVNVSAGGQVNTVVGTTDEIDIDITDPVNPILSLAAAVIASLALADSAIQAQTLQLSGAYSDEGVTDLVASTTVPVWSKRVGYAFSLTDWTFDIMTAPTGSSITLDVHKNGTTIYSTKPTIAAAAFVSSGGVLTTSPTTFALTDLIEVFTDVVGSTIPGKGLKGDPIGTLT